MNSICFGKLITKLRTEKGFSQYQLGCLVGVSDKAVSKWENGSAKPRMTTCCRLAEVLGVSLDLLLSAGNPMRIDSAQRPSWVPKGQKAQSVLSFRRDVASTKRIELHVHTGCSKIDGIVSAEDLVLQADKWGHSAIAVTDYHSLQELPQLLRCAHRVGIKAIPGCELQLFLENGKTANVMVLAQNREGIINLNELLTIALSAKDEKMRSISRKDLQQHRNGILIGCSCNNGEIGQAIQAGLRDDQLQQLASFYDYLQIQPPENEEMPMEKARDQIRSIVRLGKALHKAVVAVSNCRYIEPQDSLYRRVLLYNSGRTNYEDQGVYYLRTTEEMLQAMAFLGAKTASQVVVDATALIASQIDPDISLLPPHEESLDIFIPNAEEYVTTFAVNRAHEIYGDILPSFVEQRLQQELQMMRAYNHWVRFAVAAHLAAVVHKKGGNASVRGTLSASLVAWLLDITVVNPLVPHYRCPSCKHTVEAAVVTSRELGAELPAQSCSHCGTPMIGDGAGLCIETLFGLNGERKPDISMNFPAECLPDVHAALVSLFGEDHILRYGLPDSLGFEKGRAYARRYLLDHDMFPAEETIHRIVSRLCNCIISHQVRLEGCLIIPPNCTAADFTALELSQGEDGVWVPTTHLGPNLLNAHLWCCHCIEHSNSALIGKLEQRTGITYNSIPLQDEKVFELFHSPAALGLSSRQILCEAGVYGISLYESAAGRKLLAQIHPSTLAELTALSGMLLGTGIWNDNTDNILQSNIARLCDLPIFRDDIIHDLTRKGIDRQTAFHVMDRARMGRKMPEEIVKILLTHGIPQWYIDCLQKGLNLFPKSHVVNYLDQNLRLAWYKLHQPQHFYPEAIKLRAKHLQSGDLQLNPNALRSEILAERTRYDCAQWEKHRQWALELILEAKERGIDLSEIRT